MGSRFQHTQLVMMVMAKLCTENYGTNIKRSICMSCSFLCLHVYDGPKQTLHLKEYLHSAIHFMREHCRCTVWEPDQSFKAHNWISKQKRTWYLSTQPIIALKEILKRNGIDLPSKNMNRFRSQRNEVVLISWLCMDNHLQHLWVC
jgi:hypothetical protein